MGQPDLEQIEQAIRTTVQEHINLVGDIGPVVAEDVANDAMLKIVPLLKGDEDGR